MALFLLQESRRQSRVTKNGDLIPLENQDRSLWDQNRIREGMQSIHQAIMSGRLGSYTLQAAIASVPSGGFYSTINNTKNKCLGNFSVSDGPFIEGKELIPGFTVISVDSKQEAIEWAKELRECMGGGVLKLARLSATSPNDL